MSLFTPTSLSTIFLLIIGGKLEILGELRNIPASMLADQFGMAGLVSYLRCAEDRSVVSLALGDDLTTYGLNLNLTEWVFLFLGFLFYRFCSRAMFLFEKCLKARWCDWIFRVFGSILTFLILHTLSFLTLPKIFHWWWIILWSWFSGRDLKLLTRYRLTTVWNNF